MTEQEYIDISNLARLRIIHSAMAWLLPMTKEEHATFNEAQKALHAWSEALEKRTDGLIYAAGIEPVACGWQPIETAPIDGTPILAWVKGCNKHHDYGDTLVVRADQTMNKVYLDRGGERFWGFPGVGGLRASHWMPLPANPTGI